MDIPNEMVYYAILGAFGLNAASAAAGHKISSVRRNGSTGTLHAVNDISSLINENKKGMTRLGEDMRKEHSVTQRSIEDLRHDSGRVEEKIETLFKGQNRIEEVVMRTSEKVSNHEGKIEVLLRTQDKPS